MPSAWPGGACDTPGPGHEKCTLTPTSDDSDGIDRGSSDEPTHERTVRELLLDRIDEHCRLLALELEQVTRMTEQLDPERARSCRNAITMASVMVDEIRLRAHARPLDEDGGLDSGS